MNYGRVRKLALLLAALALLWTGRDLPGSAGAEGGMLGALRGAYIDQPKAVVEALVAAVNPPLGPGEAPRIQQTQGGGSISVSIGPIVSSRDLAFAGKPMKGSHGFALGVQPSVAVRVGGVTDTSDGATVVTLGIKTGTGTSGATLDCGGGLIKTVVQGIASFSGCKIDLKGDGYVLQAVASGFIVVETDPFDVIWAGDANGDCRVDIADFSVLVRSFFKSPADIAFDLRADMNGDNIADIQDFSILKTMFGTRCPPTAGDGVGPPGGGGGGTPP